MSSSILAFLIFSLLSFFPKYPSISIPIHHLPFPPHPDPFHSLATLVNTTLLRTQLIKKSSRTSTLPLSPHSYGAYSISLSFGTPPQSLPFLFDTGSQLTWLPCTKSYLCRNCNSNSSPTIFLPKLSSSSKLIGCRNDKCTWFHKPNTLQECRNCQSTTNCSAVCPPYFLLYGSGSTAGLLLSETLTLSTALTYQNFGVGCSLVSDNQPGGGIAAFGRGPSSLPNQLILKRFSYCLISRKYDDDITKAGSLVLDGEKDSSHNNVTFTPLLKNPARGDVFSVYYYLGLHRITVGGKKVKMPLSVSAPDANGNGGTIIDSGTTLTYMEKTVFEELAAAFVEQVKYKRSVLAEQQTGLRPCFEVQEEEPFGLPSLVLKFKGGLEVDLPLANYFVVVGPKSKESICLTIVSDGGDNSGAGSGPSIILGNFQQQNYYIVYDLERERLGFRQQSCIET